MIPGIDDANLARSSSSDRLVSTLFVAAVVHGVLIMGITFNAFQSKGAPAPTLEVVMLRNEPRELTINDDAPYLASSSQFGHGTTADTVRATTQMSADGVFANPGSAAGWSPFDAAPGEPGDAQDIVATRAPADHSAPTQDHVTENPAQTAMQAQLTTAAAPDALNFGEAANRNQAQGETTREVVISVSTREAAFAGYLSLWKGKIEKVGTLHFPDNMRRKGLDGNPILEVAIRANGTLEDIVVRRPSNHPELDQAALRILRLASPFDPFPEEIRRDYDVLRFVYEWRFVDGDPDESGGRVSAAPQ